MNDSDRHKPGQVDSEKDQDSLKQDMTSHWDLDVLSRKELEQVMVEHRSTVPRTVVKKSADKTGTPDDQTDSTEENPLKAGLLLLAFAVVLLVAGVLLLRL